MTKHLLFILLPVLLIVAAGCKQQTSSEQLTTIDLAGNLKNTVENLPLSDAAASVDIVQLETSDESFIRNMKDIIVTEHDIIIEDYTEGIFRFSRDGKFLNKISKKGEGPEEYLHIKQILINEEKEELYLWSYNRINVFDFDGTFKRCALSKPQEDMFYGANAQLLIFKQYYFLNDVLPVLYMKEKLWSFALADSSFTPLKEFYNPDFLGREEAIKENHSLPIGWKNYWMEKAPANDFYGQTFKMMFFGGDTLYQFNEQTLAFEPLYKLNHGKRPTFEMEHQWIADPAYFGYLRNNSLFDSKEYLYFLCCQSEQSYICRYDKKKGEIVTMQKDCPIKVTPFPGSPNFIHRIQLPEFTLQNDLTDGEDFTVDYKSQGRYWIDECKPDEEAEHARLVKLLGKISEEDNPVLFIATLK